MNAYVRTIIFFNTQAFNRLFLLKITILKMYVCAMKTTCTKNIFNITIFMVFIFILNNKTSKGKNQVYPHHIKRTPSY
jgi:hypothetical protein